MLCYVSLLCCCCPVTPTWSCLTKVVLHRTLHPTFEIRQIEVSRRHEQLNSQRVLTIKQLKAVLSTTGQLFCNIFHRSVRIILKTLCYFLEHV